MHHVTVQKHKEPSSQDELANQTFHNIYKYQLFIGLRRRADMSHIDIIIDEDKENFSLV